MYSILCAGSLSVAPSDRLDGQISNMFHVIDVFDRDTMTKSILGKIENYKFSSIKGWTKNIANEFVVLDDVVYFGKILSETETEIKMAECFNEFYLSCTNVKNLPEYLELPLELKCLNYKILNEFVVCISKKNGFAVRGSYPEMVTIIKE